MKSILKRLFIGFLGSLSLGVVGAQASLEVSAAVQIHATADFYEPLAARGTWVEVGSYGRCWHPSYVAVEWRPYCYGSWVWTDCGWYWETDEPWGWACYHYGTWAYDPFYGWVWVPGIEWAPAWVSWRYGGGYIGWAPLAPRGVVVVKTAPAPFVFVEVNHFHEPVRPATVIVNNTTIINNTTQINNIRQETRTFSSGAQKVMVNEGPGLAPVQNATAKKVRVVSIRDAVSHTTFPPSLARSKTLPGGTEHPGTAADGGNQVPHEQVLPPTGRPATPPPGPPVRHLPQGRGEGRGHDRER